MTIQDSTQSTAAETAEASGNASSEATPADPIMAKLQELEAAVKEKEQKYLYLYADFENYKKRTVKERSDLIKFGWEPIARDLLQVIDNLERAVHHAGPSTDKNLVEGLKMVLSHFHSILQRQGIEKIGTSDKPFDPNLHEAVGEEASSEPQGSIVKEELKGYTLHGRLLRPARVIVSAGNSATSNGTT